MEKILENYQEISKSFEVLKRYDNVVTIFGSARINSSHKDYKKVQKLACKLGEMGYSIMTGGGPGMMEAANRGLLQAKEKNPQVVSIGLNIQLPNEQHMNPYVEVPLIFENFFSRKLVFNHNSTAFIVAMGGFGTLDELSEVLVQISTGKHKKIPIILYGRDYWKGLIKWFKNRLLKEGMISKEELALLSFADSPKEVLRIFKKQKNERKDSRLV